MSSKAETEKQFADFVRKEQLNTNLDIPDEQEDDQKDLAQVENQIKNANAEDSDAPSSHTEERSGSVASEKQPSGANSIAGEAGGDTDSVNNQSQSSHQNTDSILDGNSQSGADSSRGSTKATGDVDNSSHYMSEFRHRTGFRNLRGEPEEDEKEADGSPMMTQRYLNDLLKKEWRQYYRTAYLNEKLYLHYKGFTYLRNMEQFTDLKCLYFEGNGCKSTLGLEHNVQLRSLFMQENLIKNIEGLDNLKELAIFNVNDNLLDKVDGLSQLPKLTTFYAKRNKLGRYKVDDKIDNIAALKGLLDCPSIACLDISDNYLDDPEIVPQILEKMPNLGVLYSQGNDFQKKCSSYRKMIIAKIPTLKFVDDRPVFPEDRRRAEAYARGGIEEERKEMKLIKKEKEAKHWANHDAFLLMVNKAKEDKKEREEAKEAKTQTMKEMMAAARAEKELAKRKKDAGERGEILETIEDTKNVQAMAAELKAIAAQREKDIMNDENVQRAELQINEVQKLSTEKQVEEYNALYQKQQELEAKRLGLSKHSDQTIQDEGATVEEIVDEEEDAPPDLEDVDLEELNQNKEVQQKEWLKNVVNDTEKSRLLQAKAQEARAMMECGSGLKKDDGLWQQQQAEAEGDELHNALMDEKRVRDAMAKISQDKVESMLNEQADALQPSSSNFEELD